MVTKTAILLAGAAFSVGAPASAQSQCGGRGSSNCYITSSLYSPPGGCYTSSTSFAACYSAAGATCKNPSNQRSYYVSSNNALGLCYPAWAFASANGRQNGTTQLETAASVWSYWNFAGYWKDNYTDCSNTKWSASGGRLDCF